jgi:hypothetical protein
VCSSSGQAHSGQRGGCSYTSTFRSQYGQSPSRIAGGSTVSFVMGVRARGERSNPASARSEPTLNQGGERRSCPVRQQVCPNTTTILLYPVRGPPGQRRPRKRTRPSGREGLGAALDRGSGGLTAPALAPRHVAVYRFVLPAELPLVVSRELGAASSLGTDPVAFVLPVGPRERADRCSPVRLLCHVVHILSDGTGGREGVAAPLCTLFERRTTPVHSEV